MSKAYKGGDFEREICKQLSKWWTGGERDDVYWRTSQSGGRATFRRKTKGIDTHGHQGDIAAVDPIGAPLLKLFTIELKRGSSVGCAGELIDSRDTPCVRPFEAAIHQAIEAHKAAHSIGWMLICRRDHRRAMVYAEYETIARLRLMAGGFGSDKVLFDIHINGKPKAIRVRFVAMYLERFLARFTPEMIVQCVESLQ